MQNSAYWKKRFEALEDDQYKKSQKYIDDMESQFREAQNNISMDIEHWYQRLADNNDISLASAKKLLKKDELEEFHWTVEQYIRVGEENALNQAWLKELENASAKVHIQRLEAMKLQMQQHVELLYTKYHNGVTDYLNKSYADRFYHTAYEIQKGTGIGSNLAILDTRKIDKVLTTPWATDGKNFSDRIWSNKDKLVNELHRELTQSLIRGDDPRKAINNLARNLNKSKVNAGRLVMTETAAISSAAQKDCFKELDVELFEIVATLDSHTSDICQEMDGKHFKMSEWEVGVTAPPFHVWCRSTTVPYFDDDLGSVGERAARDENGKTVSVPGDMTFEEWKNSFVVGDTEKPVKPSEELYKRNRTGERIIRSNKKDVSVAKNKYGKEIKFDFSKAKKPERYVKVEKDIKKLANEYDTYLHDVTIGAVRAAGDTSVDGLIRLNNAEPKTYIHEFAHAISMQDRVRVGLADEKEVEFMKELARIRTRYENECKGNPKKGIPSNPAMSISSYSHASKDEFFAEAVCLWDINGQERYK